MHSDLSLNTTWKENVRRTLHTILLHKDETAMITLQNTCTREKRHISPKKQKRKKNRDKN